MLLIVLNGIVLLVMALLVLGQLVFLFIEKRHGTPGAALHLRLVSLFSLIAVVPAIIVAVFATVTLNRGLDAWFSERTRAIVDSAERGRILCARSRGSGAQRRGGDFFRPVAAEKPVRHRQAELRAPGGAARGAAWPAGGFHLRSQQPGG